MKVLFVADHHIKLGQKNVPKKWARDRYSLLWNTLHTLALDHKVDCVIHGGDIFDRVPTPEETGIMLDMFKVMKGNYYHLVYPGNHEATSKYKSFWEEFESLEAGDLRLVHNFMQLEPEVHILPYTDLKKKDWQGTKGRILFTHVRGEIPPHVKPEIDLNLFNTWDIVFAGDLHSHENSQLNIIYPGSPVTTSFHRNRSSGNNGVLLIDTDTTSYKFVPLDLPQLLRKTITSPEEMIATSYDHTVYELIGDASELANLETNELLDKKIVQRDTEASMKTKDLSIEEELDWYLTEVEGIKSQETKEEILNDYANLKESILE